MSSGTSLLYTRPYHLRMLKYNGTVGKIYIEIEKVWSSSRVSGTDRDREAEEGQGVTPVRSIDGICWRMLDELTRTTGGVWCTLHAYTVSLEESQCCTEGPWARTNVIWVVSFKGYPLDKPISGSTVISVIGYLRKRGPWPIGDTQEVRTVHGCPKHSLLYKEK